MVKKIDRNKARLKRHERIRTKISGTSEIPRFSVFKSNKEIYVQIIDDLNSKTLINCSTKQLKLANNNIENCQKVGKEVAKKAKKEGINQVVFDRSGYQYHGKIKALADAAREEGLKI